ncbi:DUF2059 domain-containing protein [uncultured Roseovarius sp.]|uniref:DUF2059 domain-containing protein n=1 Tax=uncultured Roseovarius sp. TaxID=293344 RepID=UPI0025947954|nr:DUF2059 domain-containing protein [uncultured Roseovarius sp.]
MTVLTQPATVAMRPVRLILAILALTVATLPAGAADRDRLQAFLEVTGFGVALDSIALSATDAPQMLGMQASDFGTEWRHAAEDVFDTDGMRETALSILEQTLSDELLTHAAAFYASPLGQRLVEVENASHMTEDDSAKAARGEALIGEMVELGDQRIDVLRGLTTAVNGDDVAVRAVQEVQVRFLMAASYAGVLENELDEGALRALMRANESDLRVSLSKSALSGAAYTYRDISNDDLVAYLEALKEPQMQRVYELMNAVQYEIMASRFEVLAARMATLNRGQDL